MRTRSSIRGFSLIELSVVVVIIAILATLLAPTILGKVEESRVGRARTDTYELAMTVARMRIDTATQSMACLTNMASTLPLHTSPAQCGATLQLCAAADQNVEEPCWNGPYITNVNNDPWNNAFVASAESGSYTVMVTSAGPDQVLGTSDDITFVQ
jgi:general secretion pathway protein G